MTDLDSDTAAGTDDDFETLLAESFISQDQIEGRVVHGTVVAIESDNVVIDVGLKTEGRISVREFGKLNEEIAVGDSIEVFLERIENALGEAVISRDKARREEAWNHLEVAHEKGEQVEGSIVGRVKGGFTVDLCGAVAFLPGSQVDIRPIRDITPLMSSPQPFKILKMDRRRGNIVVSRRAVLEVTLAVQRTELVSNLAEGQVLDGVVKNITDYGAFVDLGGIDGLLHVTDMAWRRINHPSEALSIGESVKVQVIRVNAETQRISLGMKQLLADPWDGIETKYPMQAKFTGRVTNIADYGAFVELEPGVEGLVHVSEMSWTKKNVHPGKIVSTSQQVEVMVLEVDSERRRVSLGLKQCIDNPWEEFINAHPVGSRVEGEVKNVTEFGLFVGLGFELDGMVHMSDIHWDKSGEEAMKDYAKGNIVKAKVLDIDVSKERISLGIKQLSEDPFTEAKTLKRGAVVTCTVAGILDRGIEVTVGEGLRGFIRRIDLSRDRSEQKPERFAVGDKLDAQITSIEKNTRRLALSIKAREIAEEKEAVQQYGSSDSGASLGDILGPAMGRARELANADLDNAEDEDAEPDYGDTEVPVIETTEADNGAESKAEAAEEESQAEAAEENETGTDDDGDSLNDVSDNPKADT
ncbi:MAG: 30S ribosomal protein S1 [Alphaproteobacteria bacterium]|nr:30S ribosomal protein S1 [Alphaproteobacteria bacterium]